MKKNEYQLYSDKVKSNKNIAIVSDLHISEKMPNTKLDEVLDTLEEIEPTHIVMPGDLFNVDISTICDDKVTDFINCATEIADVFYVKGNIEDEASILNYSILPCGLKDNKNEYFHILGEEENKIIYNDGINITGIKLPSNFYKLDEAQKLSTLFSKYSIYLDKLSSRCGNENFNILLCHDPIIRDYFKLVEAINDHPSNIDLVISGHNHGGMFPTYLKNIIEPFVKDITKYYPSYTKGMFDIDSNGHMIVSEGVTKYHSDMEILSNLERYHEGTIENVRILKK